VWGETIKALVLAQVTVMRLLEPSHECSVGIHFDFVSAEENFRIYRYILWRKVLLRVHARLEPAQDPLPGYYISC
jgi:hypothetical protein